MIHERLPGDLTQVCSLGAVGPAERTLALIPGDDRAVICYGYRPDGHRRTAEDLADRIARIAEVRHAHLLPIESIHLTATGTLWLTTPYTGNQEGLVTLAGLARAKAGQCSPFEVLRAVTQLLEGADAAHAQGIFQGPFDPDAVLVDTRGSLFFELYAVRRLFQGLSCDDRRLARDEVSSVASLAYHLLTGIPAAEPRVRATRLVKRLDRAWDAWFEEALDPSGGFESARDALDALPGREPAVPVVTARSSTVLSRFRRASNARRD